jgi:Cytochrome P460
VQGAWRNTRLDYAIQAEVDMTPQAVRSAAAFVAGLVIVGAAACGNAPTGPTAPSTASTGIRDDAALFRLISQTDPLSRYSVFPDADEFTTGRLNGSEAHRPVIRVSLNTIAAGALQNGRLPAGARFPDGSIVLKEIRSSQTAAPTLYAVMVKDSGSALAGNGWLWAELGPSSSVTYSVSNRGAVCTRCHLLERGPQNDLVRSFERQR